MTSLDANTLDAKTLHPKTLDAETLEAPLNSNQILLTQVVSHGRKLDLLPVQDSHGLHFVAHERFLIDPKSHLAITYGHRHVVVHPHFLYFQPTPHGDQCIYLTLADDLTISFRGVHEITDEFIEKVHVEFKKDIINKRGWFACSLCEVMEGSSLG